MGRQSAGRWAGAGALLLLAGLVLVGCTARTPLNPLDWYGPEFLTLFWALLVGGLAGAEWLRARDSGPADDYQGPPLSTYALARLAHRSQRLADSALAALAHGGYLELLDQQRVCHLTDQPPTNAYERTVWSMVTPVGWSSLPEVRTRATSPHLDTVQALDDELEQRGLLLPSAERRRLDRYPLWAAGALAGLGLSKLAVGLGRGRPVGWLLLSLLALAIISVVMHQYGAWATNRGQRLLVSFLPEVRKRRRAAGPPTAELVALTVALLGVSELGALGLEKMARYLTPPPGTNTGGDGSSGGGDGGGDGGSGCGGCGGCGGD